tara:strand:+ start:893 stop:1330 length:438 start_codon:yes stop_codon:yes gene_type:complete
MADKELQSIMEAFYNAAPYGNSEQSESEDKESVSYNRTKKQGDATVTVSANADSMEELHQILKLAGIDPHGLEGSKGPEAHDHEEGECDDSCSDDCPDCDHDEAEGGEEGPVMIRVKPASSVGYNPVGGDKKEILNALMNRYKSL